MSVRSRQLALSFDEGGEETMTPTIRGGKGLGLAILTKKGMPVPYGFTIPTGVCRAYLQHKELPNKLDWHLDRCLSLLEQKTGKRLGDAKNPLLLSVRSGAAESMPGMMDTILNVGFNDNVHEGLARIGGVVFADDCHERFKSSFQKNVIADGKGCDCEDCMPLGRLRDTPADPRAQVKGAITSVFGSWNSERAVAYRTAHGIPHWQGTAVTVQEMVFGNMGDDSCTGVVFSRDVRTGTPGLYGEFLPNAQGEDVVAGTRTPRSIKSLAEWNPQVHEELTRVVQELDRDHNDIVDVEFTVERGKLFLLQCRKAKRSARAAALHAVHQVWGGILDRREAVKQVTPAQIRELRRDVFEKKAWSEAVSTRLLMKGLPASPGSAVGRAAFTSSQAESFMNRGMKCILIRRETSPSDLSGMLAAAAIVTAVGGETSHAAVVARSLHKPAVVSCDTLHVEGTQVTVQGVRINHGDIISVSGDTGEVVRGEVEVIEPDTHGEVANLLRWVRQFKSPTTTQGVPRIVFEHMERRENVNTMLNDFYLSEAMARSAQGSSLSVEAQALRTRVHTDTAEFLACYLLVAVAGEIRHARSIAGYIHGDAVAQKAFAKLAREYSAIGTGKETRRGAQLRAVQFLQDRPPSDPVTFLRLCASVFDHPAWSGSYGGSRWAAIARAPMRFLAGEINHTVFADHAFDLRHNAGRMFDKHPMVSEKTSDGGLHGQLEEKKAATSIEKLHNALEWTGYAFGSEVLAFWNQGVSAGLWGPRKVQK